MSDPVVARRYAQALYQEAEAAGKAERVDADVDTLRAGFEGSRELTRLFASPVVPVERKRAVADRLFAERVDPLTLRLVRLLLDKGREALLPAVARAYGELRDERAGVVEAHVRTAFPLGPDEADDLRAALERSTGQKVRLRLEVDPALIGGLVVRVGDTVYDGSARHHLDRLREQFAQRVYLSN
jgi:F-type H+-transporting ATPase subunit delta